MGLGYIIISTKSEQKSTIGKHKILFRYHMAMRTLHQKRINDKIISKASGMGIGFHVMLCGGKLNIETHTMYICR